MRLRGWYDQFKRQFRANLVAIISLLTALSGFYYNTWRDHQNELNHNMRNAAFEVLKELGELQTVVNYAHFEQDKQRGNTLDGWGHVVLIRDVSRLMTPAAAAEGQQLYAAWQQQVDRLGVEAASEQHISKEITEMREAVLASIRQLQ
ncbi:hypothetical protein [Methylobacillus flagellatus]|uniref:hypothetical protein n=1 Tax=Methylobacillus flagellatus TaxID=405 RepID=UPI0010F52D25|nr:hypothetical protein [Methylobacillus flagellatus]